MLSAASENVSALLRALSENHRVDILQRPQIMTLDNQPAFIQVGQRVPRITAVTINALTGNTNSITLDNVGLILGVTPRISPDGLVVMQIDAEKSELESEATGIPIFTSPSGQVIRSPIIDATTAQTTVAAMSDQTVVLGGLITKSETKEHHGVPVLDDIPVLNNFFRYDSTIEDEDRTADHHDAAHRQEPGGGRGAQADRGRQDELVPQRRDQDLRRSRPAAADRRVDRRRGPRDLSGRRPAARRQSAGRAGNDSDARWHPDARPTHRQPAAHACNGAAGRRRRACCPAKHRTGARPTRALRAAVSPRRNRPAVRARTGPTATPPGVQAANYQPQQWQAGNTAQPAVYQAPVADRHAVPSFNYQQPPPPSALTTRRIKARTDR